MSRPPGQPNPASGPAQLGLFDAAAPAANLWPEAEFIAALAALLPGPHLIRLTDNRSSLITVKPQKNGPLVVRLQRVFLASDQATLKALARFIVRPDRRCRAALDTFLSSRRDLLDACAREGREDSLKARGRHYNLNALLKKVKAEYGLRLPGVRIGWARLSPAGRNRRSIKFGSWYSKSRTVRVHPALDDPSVPEFFVEYIIYHELLHALFPPEPGSGSRRLVHPPEFTRFERKFKMYREARAFEREYVRLRLK